MREKHGAQLLKALVRREPLSAASDIPIQLLQCLSGTNYIQMHYLTLKITDDQRVLLTVWRWRPTLER